MIFLTDDCFSVVYPPFINAEFNVYFGAYHSAHAAAMYRCIGETLPRERSNFSDQCGQISISTPA